MLGTAGPYNKVHYSRDDVAGQRSTNHEPFSEISETDDYNFFTADEDAHYPEEQPSRFVQRTNLTKSFSKRSFKIILFHF